MPLVYGSKNPTAESPTFRHAGDVGSVTDMPPRHIADKYRALRYEDEDGNVLTEINTRKRRLGGHAHTEKKAAF